MRVMRCDSSSKAVCHVVSNGRVPCGYHPPTQLANVAASTVSWPREPGPVRVHVRFLHVRHAEVRGLGKGGGGRDGWRDGEGGGRWTDKWRDGRREGWKKGKTYGGRKGRRVIVEERGRGDCVHMRWVRRDESGTMQGDGKLRRQQQERNHTMNPIQGPLEMVKLEKIRTWVRKWENEGIE